MHKSPVREEVSFLLYSALCCDSRCLQTFLVRKCVSSQRKVLCLRVTADKSASSVQECFICEEDSSEYDCPTCLGSGCVQVLRPPPVKHVPCCLHTRQSISVSSVTSIRLGELGAQFSRPVSPRGLLLHKQVSVGGASILAD